VVLLSEHREDVVIGDDHDVRGAVGRLALGERELQPVDAERVASAEVSGECP